MIKNLLALLLFSQISFAGLPPTSTKGSTDSNPVTTFEFDFPNSVVTHTGTKASFASLFTIGALDAQAPNATGLSLTSGILSTQSANATYPGLINNTTQTFSGTKNFNDIGAATDGTYDIGASSTRFNNIYAKGSIAAGKAPYTPGNTAVILNGPAAALDIYAGGSSAYSFGPGPASGVAIANVGVGGRLLTLAEASAVFASGLTGVPYLTSDASVLTAVGTLTAANFSGSSSGTNTGDVTLGTANGLSLASQALSLGLSSTSTTGALSSTDWNTFNNKQPAGSYITALSGDVVAAGPGSAAATIQPLVVTNSKIANSTIDLTAKVTGTLPIANGGTNNSTAYTANSIVFSDGTKLTQDNTNFNYDSSTKKQTISGDVVLSNANYNNVNVGNAITTVASTGLISAVTMTINANPAKFNIPTFTAIFVDESNPLAPTQTTYTYPGSTANTITNITTQEATYISVNSSGSILQTIAPLNPVQSRTYVNVGALLHSSHTQIDYVYNFTSTIRSSIASSVNDLSNALGIINVTGNIISGNGATLNINKSAGSTFLMGISPSTPTSPNLITDPATVAQPFFSTWRDGAGGWTTITTSLLVPGKYDNNVAGGVTAPVTNLTTNRWQLFKVWQLQVINKLVIEFGQVDYASSSAALGAVNLATTDNPSTGGLKFRGWFLVRGGATSLTSTADAIWLDGGKLGQTSNASGGSSTTTLQQAYDNSTQPQIVVNATQLGVQVRDAATPLGSSLFAVQNNAGSSNYLNVAASGITLSSLGTGIVHSSSVGLLSSSNVSLTSEVTGTLPIANGGTGQTTKAAAFDALSPMTTGGDIIYGGTSGTGTRLANGSAGQYLSSQGGTSAPVWQTFTQPTIQIFTSGSGTYTRAANVVRIEVEMVGAGGAGAANGSGPSAGTAGGSTTFGAATSAGGGFAGAGGGGAGGAGGANTLAYTTIKAFAGQAGFPGGYAIDQPGASGGNSYFTGAGVGSFRGAAGTAPGGTPTANSGSGGGGAGGNGTYASGAGGGAGAYQNFFINSPSATYSYGVGAAGTLGGAGGGGSNSGPGSVGQIIVREYYQ